jgi:hypothetical protein
MYANKICPLLLAITFSCTSMPIAAQTAPTGYHTAIVIGQDGNPKFAITNDGSSPITAFAATIDLSSGLRLGEERIYYDSAMDDLHYPAIIPGHTAKIPVGHVVGADFGSMTPEVHAVIFFDGTTQGEDAWIQTILARRGRLYQRLATIRALLLSHVSMAPNDLNPEADLAVMKSDAHSSLPDDEIRIVDDVAIDSAILTMTAADVRNGDPTISSHVQRLVRRMTILKSAADSLQYSRQSGQLQFPPPAPRKMHYVSQEQVGGIPMLLAVLEGFGGARLPSFSLHFPARVPIADIYKCYLDTPTGDKATVVQTLDSCGPSRLWDLKASIQDTDKTTGKTTLVPFDAGNYKAYGACWSASVDCNGQSHSAGNDAGGEQLVRQDNGSYSKFWWQLDDWSSPTTSACNVCDPYPSGVTVSNSTDTVYTSPFFTFTDNLTSPGCTVSQ